MKSGMQESRKPGEEFACGSRLENTTSFFLHSCFPAFLIVLLAIVHASLWMAWSVRLTLRELGVTRDLVPAVGRTKKSAVFLFSVWLRAEGRAGTLAVDVVFLGLASSAMIGPT